MEEVAAHRQAGQGIAVLCIFQLAEQGIGLRVKLGVAVHIGVNRELRAG